MNTTSILVEDRDLHTTVEMALYRHRIEQELRENCQWLATTLKSIGDAVIATDHRGYVKYMNPVAEALTGWSQTEASGKNFEEVFNIINGRTRLPAKSPMIRAIQENRTVKLEDNTLLVAKNGSEIQIDDNATPIVDNKGQVYGVVVVFHEITERKQAEEQLRQFARELQTQNAELDAFSHTVAHDLKSPLNPIIGFADLLVKEQSTLPADQVTEFLQVIARGARKMANVVDELLLLAHSGQADVSAEPLSMTTIVTEALQRLDYMIEEYQAEIIRPDDWPAAVGYAPWIEGVWANYLSNAIKYGGRPPRLELGAARHPDKTVRFWVKDNGPGLNPDAQAQLFTPFTQLGQIRIAGHGLGLSIVRRIVEKLGGQVGLESDGVPGKGCEFYFTLPGEEPGARGQTHNGKTWPVEENSTVSVKA